MKSSAIRVLLAIAVVVFLTTGRPGVAQAKTYGVIGTVVVDCAEATKYRDGELFSEFSLLLDNYDKGREVRRAETMATLQQNLADLEASWAATGAVGRRKIAANAVALALASASAGTAKWIKAKDGLNDQQRIAADELLSRSATLTSSVVSGGFTGSIDVSDLVLLPVNTISSVLFPPAALGLTVYSIGKGLIGTGFSLADYYLDKDVYQAEAKMLRETITKIAMRSADGQIARINKIKNEIDKTCN